jgi:putative ABC transport system permease protein
MNVYVHVAAAIRSLWRSAAFSCFVVLVFAAGSSANALVFAIADAVVFRPFPVPDSDRLVIAGENLIEPRSEITYRDFVAWRQQSQTFSDIALTGSSDWSWRLRTSGDSAIVHYRAVSGNFFSVLGTAAKLGRTLRPADDRPESRRTVVLGYGFWQRQFGGDPTVIGRTLVLSDVPFTIVGVMPEHLLFPSRADVWTPVVPELAAIAASIRDLPPDGGDVGVFYVLGRLKPGVGVDAAISSVIPAIRVAHRDVDSILRRTGRSTRQPGLRHPVRRVLIGGELAAAVVLVTAAGLLARSVSQLRHLDIGFDPNGPVAIEMGMPAVFPFVP